MHSFKKTYILPFKFDIPNYTQNFLNNNNFFKRYIKFVKRYLYIIIKGQKTLEIDCIKPNQRSILWINVSAPSIGDSIMDLSSRVLINDRKIDLYTEISNSKIYEHDLFISKVFTNKSLINQDDYDAVILDSYSTRSIRIKNDIAPEVPFMGMFGFYNGPEINRVLFSFHRMNQLLGYINSENEISKIAKAYLEISINDKNVIEKIKLPVDYISIAIGGEWAYRTFNQWDLVIKKLLNKNRELNIILVGSENAREKAKELMDNFLEFNIINCVAKFTFNQTAEIINKSSILLCCDGGLMHAANAVNTPIIPIFARLNQNMQLTKSICSFALFDESDVNNIGAENIFQKYVEASDIIENSSIFLD